MSYQAILNNARHRRSIYALNKFLPISQQAVQEIIHEVVKHTPSSFNSQSTRIVALFGEEHEKLWQLTKEALKAIVPAENFEPTAEKMATFKAAAGTVLFFEDQNVIKALQTQFPLYADNFPIWAEHGNAMHQYALWTALSAANIGANLQHYNPLIDNAVAQTWQLPKNWTLRAQMVFGGIAQAAGEKAFNSIEEHVKFFG